MSIVLKNNQTKDNLMRAFAGESQARNRYIFSANEAKKQHLHVIESVFHYTADQELAHAKVFYDFLKELSGENILVEGHYPIDNYTNIIQLLKTAHHNEYEEFQDAYPSFAKVAKEEGFPKIATAFDMISKIEKTHGDRFEQFATLMEQDKLFKADTEVEWLCLNCGHLHKGTDAPLVCPVCKHNQGFFIPLSLSPFGK